MKKITLLLLVVSLLAGLIEGAEPPKVLIVANTQNWHTRIVANNPSDTPKPFAISEQGCLASAPVNVPANGAALVNAGGFLCTPITIVTAPAGIDAVSLTTFDDGVNFSSMAVPPFGAVTPERSSRHVGPIISDDDESAYVTTYAAESSELTVDIVDAANNPIGSETFAVAAGIGQYKLKTKFFGFVTVKASNSCGQFGWNCGGKPVYGFISNATAKNSNSRIYALGE